MIRTKIESSQIAEVGYDDDLGVLEIKFHPNKHLIAAVWQYENVHRSVYESMIDPDVSAGRVFHAEIKTNPSTPGTKIAEIDESLAVSQ